VSFNLVILIRIKLYETIYIFCKVAITWLDLVRPLCGHYSLGLLSVDNLNIIFIIYAAFIGALGSTNEPLDGDIIIRFVEIGLSHHRLQYLTLVLVDDCFLDKATPDLLMEIIHKRFISIKQSSGSTKLNGIVGVRVNVFK
jgi:hypothetical protein